MFCYKKVNNNKAFSIDLDKYEVTPNIFRYTKAEMCIDAAVELDVSAHLDGLGSECPRSEPCPHTWQWQVHVGGGRGKEVEFDLISTGSLTAFTTDLELAFLRAAAYEMDLQLSALTRRVAPAQDSSFSTLTLRSFTASNAG